MDALVEALFAIPAQPLGTVVHVGPGAFALDHHEGLEADRLVLVEGDPEACESLRRDARLIGRAELVEAVVAPTAGALAWNRYHPRVLNGPLEASRWATLFPRLRSVGRTLVKARALSEVLDALGLPDGAAAHARVLALDLPGQEDGLLAALDGQRLRRFDWIVLRSDGADGPSAASRSHLAAAGFTPAANDGTADRAWPVTSFRFDRATHAAAEAARQIDTLQVQLAQAARREAALAERLAQVEAELRAVQDRRADADLLANQKTARQGAELAAARGQIEALRKTVAEGEAARAALLKRATDAEATAGAARKQQAEAEALRARLQEQVADRDARQRRIDTEVLRAEAQLALIKDVLLREKNF